MTAPRCTVCNDTGSKSQDIDGFQDCTVCDAAERRAEMQNYISGLSPNMPNWAKCWAAYNFGMQRPVAAPSVASSAPADELPADITKDDALWRAGCKAFRAALNEMTGCDGYVVQKTYEAIRAHIVGQAAIAASQQAAPKAALTDADILAQWEITREQGGFYASMMFSTDAAIIAYARAIEAAAGPNAALTWKPLSSAGQVKKGDYVRFNLCGEVKVHKAAIILHAGTDKEEIIYHQSNNWYLITSMSIAGKGSQKNVEYLGVNAAVAAALASLLPTQEA